MCTNLLMGVVTCLCALSCAQVSTRQARDSIGQNEAAGVTIVHTSHRVTDSTLELKYQIRNGSEQDVWICESASIGGGGLETYLAEDTRTLMVRRRFDVQSEVIWAIPPTGRYVRLRPGEDRTETLLLALPIHWNTIFTSTGAAETTYASRLALEIGFHNGALFQAVLDFFDEKVREKAQKSPQVLTVGTSVFPGYSPSRWKTKGWKIGMKRS